MIASCQECFFQVLSTPFIFSTIDCYANKINDKKKCPRKNANQMIFLLSFFLSLSSHFFFVWILIINQFLNIFMVHKLKHENVYINIQMVTHSPKKKVEPLRRPMLYAPTTQIYQNPMESKQQWRSTQQLLIN